MLPTPVKFETTHNQTVLQGLDKFRNKLIPHVFMSKDSFPPGLTSEAVLAHTFKFIESWKSRLFQMLSTGHEPLTEVNNISKIARYQ
jgi:hypothetical protein